MSNTFDKQSVLDSFIEEVNSYLPEIETNLERLAQSPGDMDALDVTYRRTHTIGGAASMMDFSGLEHVARGMEDIFADALDGLATLDGPALGLLQRSLGRLHQLLEGVRSGIDEEAIIAEDDADYTGYRAQIEALSAPSTGKPEASPAYDQPTKAMTAPSYTQTQQPAPSSYQPEPPYQPAPQPAIHSAMPSFDEVLASFRTAAVVPGEDVSWPEDGEQFEEPATPPAAFSGMAATSWEPLSVSALDTLVASTRRPVAPLTPPTPPTPALEPPLTYTPPVSPAYEEEPYEQSAASWMQSQEPVQSFIHDNQPLDLAYYSQPASQVQALPQSYTELQEDTQALEVQADSLRIMLGQLREAMTVIEEQRVEFKGFLNGSKDALERMEVWAGEAMGLNLRNSPEQVRRYLPLSVMWVSNTKLKKVLDLLQQITSGTELTEAEMHHTLRQLHNSLASFGDVFQQMQGQHSSLSQQEPGWSAWEMRYANDREHVRERVTFERQGDLAALRAEMEVRVREELRQEYEAQRVSTPTRAELESQIRAELRKEFEERQTLQDRASDGTDREALKDLEVNLRGDIEIQVRQEFLKHITNSSGDLSAALRLPPQPASPHGAGGTNVVDSSRGSVTAAPTNAPMQPAAAKITIPPSPAPSGPLSRSNSLSATVTSYSGDIGEEAAEIFRLEAEEHLQTISIQVAALEKEPENRELIQGIRRATHTLKGAAAMMGFRAIADLCHISEDLLDTIMEGTMSISSAYLSIILDTAETLDLLITGRGSDPADEQARVRVLQYRYADLLGEQGAVLHVPDDHEPIDEHDEDNAHVTGVVTANAQGVNAARADLSVRVRLQRLDELVNLFGELLVNRSVLEERIQRLVRLVSEVAVSSNRLADVGQKLDSRFEVAMLPSGREVQVMPGEGNQVLPGSTSATNSNSKGRKNAKVPDHVSDFDPIELDRYTEFHLLARGLGEGISDMATLSTEMDTIIRECEGVFSRENRLSTTFQDRLMKARLVPLSTMAPRLYRTARAVALKQGKDFEFLLEGETTEVDRTVYEEIAGPLLHLIRNAVNHAIETPEVRIQKGKNPKGQIKLSAAYEGNQIVITVRDDGTGLDHEKVRQSAIARGLIRADQQLSESDLVSLIFHPGFSTAESLSEESGRGVGLDVVRDSVSRLRGILAVESSPGHGTAFTMTFPTSLAIQSVMMVRVGGQQFGVPTVHIESIGRLDNLERTSISGQPAVLVRNELYPVHMLAPYLSLPATPIEDKAQLMMVNAGGHRVALTVDEIRGKSDIVMKNLGPHLRDVHGIAGATVLGNGHVVLILELNGLLSTRAKGLDMPAPMTSAGLRDAAVSAANAATVRQRVDVSAGRKVAAKTAATAAAAHENTRGKHILIVDDSPSVRRVVGSMLKQKGFEVQTARDGVEALEMITAETPAAVLLDIEMPRMDGFELTSTVRAQEQYKTLPLIMLTSRAAGKHQQRAMALGASAYMVKPYQDEELVKTIRDLVSNS